MITLYESNETDFGHLGLGVLSDFEKNKSFVLRERNGQYIFEGTYPIVGNNADKIEKGKILKMSAGYRTDGQRFDIIRTVKINNREIRIYAEHYSYRTKRLGLKPQFGVTGNGDMALSIWRNNLVGEHNFETWSDVTTTANVSWRIDKMQNARNALGGVSGSILDVWGGEYEFDNNKVKLWTNMGRRSPAAIIYGKNLTDLEQDERIDETYTSIYPYAVKDEIIYTLDELYVDSKYVSNYPHRRIAVKDFSNEFDHEESITQDKLRSLAAKFIESNRVGIPKTTTEVEFVDLAQTLEDTSLLKEAEEIELCDVLTVIYPKLNIRNTEAKVVATKWDPVREAYISITVGSISTSLKSTIIQDLTDRVDQVEHNTQVVMMSANGINRIYRSVTKPIPPTTGFNVNDQWWQPNGEFMRIYFWTGDSWRLDMDTESYKKQLELKFDEQAKIDEGLRQDIAAAELAAKNAYDKAGVGESLAKEFETIIQQGGYASLKDSLGDVSLATEERLKDGFRNMVYNPDGSLTINEQTSKYIQDSVIDDDYISNQIQTSEMIQNVIKAQVPVPTDAEIKKIAESVKLTKTEIEALFEDGFLSDEEIQEIAEKAQMDPGKVQELVNGQISAAMVQQYESKTGNKYYINDETLKSTVDGYTNPLGYLSIKDYTILETMHEGTYQFEVRHSNELPEKTVFSIRGTFNGTQKSIMSRYLNVGQYSTKGTFTIPSDEYYGIFSDLEVGISLKGAYISDLKIWQEVTTKVPIETGSGVIASKLTQLNNNIDMALFGEEGAISRINVGEDGLYLKGDNIRLDGTVHMDDAFANNIFAKNIETDTFKAHSAVIANAIVDKLDVNQMTGYSATWVQNIFNGVYSRLKITGDSVDIVRNDGSVSSKFKSDGIQVFGDGKWVGALSTTSSNNFAISSKNGGDMHIGYDTGETSSYDSVIRIVNGTKISSNYDKDLTIYNGDTGFIVMQNDIQFVLKGTDGVVYGYNLRDMLRHLDYINI